MDSHKYGLIGAIAMALLSLFGTIWTVMYQTEQDTLQNCFVVESGLRSDNERLLRENVSLIIQNARQVNTIEVLETTLDGLNHPIWLNNVVHLDKPNERGQMVEFRMARINEAYQTAYQISNQEYKGKTSYEVWPEHIADVFYENDLEALRKGSVRTSETYPSSATDPNATLLTMKIDKELIILPDGSEAIIGLAYRF